MAHSQKKIIEKCFEEFEESAGSSLHVLLHTIKAYDELNKLPANNHKAKKPEPTDFKCPINKSITSQFKDLDHHSTFHSFVFYFLNLSLKQVYESYKVFYKEFDADNSLKIERHEFFALLDYFARPENMGKEKVMSSFRILSPAEHSIYAKRASTTKSTKLEVEMKQAFFNSIKMTDVRQTSLIPVEFVNYLKFLPIMMSYFAEFARKRIDLRMINLEVIRGVDMNCEELPRNGNSIYGKLKTLGFKLKKGGEPQIITLKQLERALILFRTSYAETFTNDQLKLVLSELTQKVCKLLEPESKEMKPIHLTFRLLDWISYRVCLHSALFNLVNTCKEERLLDENSKVPPHMIFEEYTMWAAAFRLQRFTPKSLEAWFLKFTNKHDKIDPTLDQYSPEYKAALTNHLKTFLKKIFPHITNANIDKLMNDFFPERIGSDPDKTTFEILAASLYDLLTDLAGQRIQEIVTTIFDGVHKGMKSMFEKKLSKLEHKKSSLRHLPSLEETKLPLRAIKTLEEGKKPEENNTLRMEPRKSVTIDLRHIDLSASSPQNQLNEAMDPQTKRNRFASEELHFPARQILRYKHRKPLIEEEELQDNSETSDTGSNHRNRRGSAKSGFSGVSKLDIASPKMSSISKIQSNDSGFTLDKAHDGRQPSSRNHLNDEDQLGSYSFENSSDRFSINKNTGRKPDILTSFWIVESFLEKYVKKDVDQRKTVPTPIVQREEEEEDRDMSDTSIFDLSERLPLNDYLQIDADRKSLSYSLTPDLTERSKEKNKPNFTINPPKMSEMPRPQSPLLKSFSSANMKLADSYVRQAREMPDQKPIFSFHLDGPMEAETNIDDISFIPGWRGNDNSDAGANGPASKEKDGRNACGCPSACIIF